MTMRRRKHVLLQAALGALALVVLGAQASPGSSAGTNARAQAANSAAQANSIVAESHPSGSWTVRCYKTPGSACDISQSVLLPPRNIRELGISIVYVAGRNLYAGQFIVPLGVSFTRGMTITVGSYTLPNLKYRRCEREGCFVEGVLPQALIDAMTQSGQDAKGTVAVEAVSGRKFSFAFALNGFGDGVELLKQLDAQRAPAISKAAKP